ncbi:MAG TPA: hypothetical protein VHO70_23710 [Chitinispirillaceae bacterium]|nr:hypothetical protein [Chitinispirillaceae bacterium]
MHQRRFAEDTYPRQSEIENAPLHMRKTAAHLNHAHAVHLAQSHYGSGSSAVMNPEMVAFADNYGFIYKAHEINHSNRKAGKERNFWTVETNFLPGRTFSSLENLNEQAY